MAGHSTHDAACRAFAADLLRRLPSVDTSPTAFSKAARGYAAAICQMMKWCVGRVWTPDPLGGSMRLVETWGHADSCSTACELLSAHTSTLVPLQENSLIAEVCRTAAPAWRNPTQDARYAGLPPDGVLRDRALYAFPVLLDGAVIAVLEFLADQQPGDDPFLAALSDHAAAHLTAAARAGLREDERRRLNLIVDQAAQPIFTVSRQGIVRTWNDGAVRAYGYSIDEAVGTPVSALLPAGASASCDLEDEAPGGGPQRRTITQRRHKDGRVVDVLSNVIPIRDSAGRIIATVRVEQIESDVTLGERRERELEQARRASQRARRIKTEFLANVSHELRTPMSAVIGMIELALGDDISPAARDYLNTAGDSARVMLSLVNDLLDQTRMESGKFELETEPFRLRRLLDDAMRGLSFRAHEIGLELICEISPDVPDLLEGDGRRFRQVVTNLVNNSLKFTEQGEIVVRVGMESCEGDEVTLSCTVDDTGPGVAPEDHERIFAPFTQVDSSTTRRQNGAGLGLTISRQIAERMHGRLWCDPQVRNGASFHFTAKVKALPDTAPWLDARRDSLQGASVLIVDDNATNRRILEAMVKEWAMRPTVVDSGASALAAVEEAARRHSPFSVIVVDALMPEMDGFTFVETLHRRGLSDAATILMLSSADRQTFENRCENLPILRYLEKPVSPRTLLEVLVDALPAVEEDKPSSFDAARPLSLLVVEDTPANQKVVKTILQKRGYDVRVAGNGREALESYKRHDFDLVLMDIQMPTMDGFQTTAAIRALDDREKATVPIVAMTAHAMAGDRVRCLRGGMNNYIAKPIDADELTEMVERTARRPYGSQAQLAPNGQAIGGATVDGTGAHHVIKGRSADQPAGSIVEPAPPASAYPASEAMESPLQLEATLKRIGGDRDLLRDLGQFFLEDAPQFLSQLHEALRTGDAQEVERAAHCLKGLAANFGAVALQEPALAVERLGRAKNLTGVPAHLEGLERELNRVVAAVRTEILGE